MNPQTSARPDVFLVSGPIRTGKTTRLRSWCDSQKAGTSAASRGGVDGILAPVVNGHRHLLHIGSGEIRDLEDLSAGTPAVTVRRFTFNASVFAWARERLLDAGRAAASQVIARGSASDSGAGPEEPGSNGGVNVPWIVVDEIGPLELSGGGLEPAVSRLLRERRPTDDGRAAFRVVMVVREGMVDGVLSHFGLSAAQVGRFPHA